jgi:hypothetical protein
MAIWNILRPFGNLVTIWYILTCLGILCQEISGNPDWLHRIPSAKDLIFFRGYLRISFSRESQFSAKSQRTKMATVEATTAAKPCWPRTLTEALESILE